MTNEEFDEKMRIGMQLVHKRLIAQKRRDHQMLVTGDHTGNVVFVDPFMVPIDPF